MTEKKQTDQTYLEQRSHNNARQVDSKQNREQTLKEHIQIYEVIYGERRTLYPHNITQQYTLNTTSQNSTKSLQH